MKNCTKTKALVRTKFTSINIRPDNERPILNRSTEESITKAKLHQTAIIGPQLPFRFPSTSNHHITAIIVAHRLPADSIDPTAEDRLSINHPG